MRTKFTRNTLGESVCGKPRRVQRCKPFNCFARNHQDAPHTSTKLNVEYIFKVFLGVISSLGILMMFLGFGVALALDDFGVDIHQILHGPGDYLAAAAYVVIEFIVRIADPQVWSNWIDRVVIYTGFGAIAVLVLWFFFMLGKHFRPLEINNLKTAHRKVKDFLIRRISYWRPAAICGSVGVVGGVIGLVPYIFLCMLVLCIMPFFIGVGLANHYFYDSVIEPVRCRPFESVDARRAAHFSSLANQNKNEKNSASPYFATCLKVTSKDGKSQSGRRVIATSEYIVLIAPETGIVNIVPSKDSVVSLLDKL